MKSVSNPVNVIRGLFGALSIIFTVSTNSIIVYADSTTDDLKAFLGITVEKHDEIKKYESNYDEILDSTESKKDKDESDSEVVLGESDVLKINLSGLSAELDTLVQSDSSPYTIKAKLDEIITVKDEIKSLGYSTSTILTDSETSSNSAQLIVYQSENDINSRWYNIGDYGNQLKFCTDTAEIVRPYGYEVEFDDETETYVPVGDKNYNLWLYAAVNSEIKAQFNGIIMSIEKDSSNKELSNICIKHGNGVFTIYRHIIPKDKLKVGDTVSQYQVIGNAGASKEEDYANHIELTLVVDKKYVNPLLMYGKSGKNIYEAFMKKSEKQYAVEKGEKYYWSEDMAVENPN